MHKNHQDKYNRQLYNQCFILCADNWRISGNCGSSVTGVSKNNPKADAKINENASFSFGVALLCSNLNQMMEFAAFVYIHNRHFKIY